MKIAYSCAGEGFGHASRMAVLLPHLEKRYPVGLFLPRTVQGFLTGKVGARSCVTIPGIHFVQNRDRIDWVGTLKALWPVVLGFPLEVARLMRRLKQGRYQAVLSDYEPHLAWAGRLLGLPVLQLNHPGVLSRVRTRGRDLLSHTLASLASGLLEGPWDQRVLISFFQGDVGPLLRPSLLRRPPREGNSLVVNLKDSYRARAVAILKRFPHLRYRLFPTPGEDFDEALLDCSAVVSPAGHQVLAEALALGKPVLALPQKGQPEQELNAAQLVSTGRGHVGSLDTFEKDLNLFLALLPQLRAAPSKPARFNLTDGTPELLTRIDTFLAAKVGA